MHAHGGVVQIERDITCTQYIQKAPSEIIFWYGAALLSLAGPCVPPIFFAPPVERFCWAFEAPGGGKVSSSTSSSASCRGRYNMPTSAIFWHFGNKNGNCAPHSPRHAVQVGAKWPASWPASTPRPAPETVPPFERNTTSARGNNDDEPERILANPTIPKGF